VSEGENKIDDISNRLTRIEASLELLVRVKMTREWYTTAEIAKTLEKSEFTVREWCRLGRIRAEKKGSGRGKFQAWVISHAEVLRIERDGLLPRMSRQANTV
jgi:hypothetical protein